MAEGPVVDPWRELRACTRARIALGRSGASLPTAGLLEFGLAHARARDAVHAAVRFEALRERLVTAGITVIEVHSAAADRERYLQRPDLGRRLDAHGAARLDGIELQGRPDVVFVVADGLSAEAVQRHAMPLLSAVLQRMGGAATAAPVVLAHQARVALGDEIGERLRARQVVVLIGERPGLSAHDSLGIYLTHEPRIGRSDAERNCISNVRPEGLAYEAAAARLLSLMAGARRLGCSGVALKDESAAGGVARLERSLERPSFGLGSEPRAD